MKYGGRKWCFRRSAETGFSLGCISVSNEPKLIYFVYRLENKPYPENGFMRELLISISLCVYVCFVLNELFFFT